MSNYPTDEELAQLREWDLHDPRGWLEFAKSIGNYWPDDSYWGEDPPGTLHVSTGGWSGNEEIIDAMQEAQWGLLWHQVWESHRRGGHYTFDLSRLIQSPPTDEIAPDGTPEKR